MYVDVPESQPDSKKVAVVFNWWIPHPNINEYKYFFESFTKFKAGADFSFYVVIKDGTPIQNEAAVKYINDINLDCEILYYSGGFDIDSYFYSANQIKTTYILYFNTSTRILADNWLNNYLAAFSNNKLAIVGATGSYQSIFSTIFLNNTILWEKNKNIEYHYKKYKLIIKNFFYWQLLFKRFPNPHIRTNAFMIKRDILLYIKKEKFKNKFDTYVFESGRKSLTAQILKMGYDIGVIDKYGKLYKIPDFIKSNTFWIDDQDGCLISDKQTEIYQKGDTQLKKLLSKYAWGV